MVVLTPSGWKAIPNSSLLSIHETGRKIYDTSQAIYDYINVWHNEYSMVMLQIRIHITSNVFLCKHLANTLPTVVENANKNTPPTIDVNVWLRTNYGDY